MADHVDLPLDEYHLRPEWSCSQLKCLPEEPELFWWRYIAKRGGLVTSDKMDLGTCGHDVLLGGAGFTVIPDDVLSSNGQRRGKAWDQFRAENAGKVLLRQQDALAVKAMTDNVMADPLARKLLEADGWCEHSILFGDEHTGLKLRARPDKICKFGDGLVIIDLKFTSDPTLAGFGRAIEKFAYHRQSAWYTEAVTQLYAEPEAFVFVAVRNEPPYECRCYELCERAENRGQAENRNAWDDLAIRLRDDNWHGPGYGRCREIDLPEFFYRKEQSL